MEDLRQKAGLISWLGGFKHRRFHAIKAAEAMSDADIKCILVAELEPSAPLPAPTVTIKLLRGYWLKALRNIEASYSFGASNSHMFRIKAAILREVARERDCRDFALEKARVKAREILEQAQKDIEGVFAAVSMTEIYRDGVRTSASQRLDDIYEDIDSFVDGALLDNSRSHEELEWWVEDNPEELLLKGGGSMAVLPSRSQPRQSVAAE